MLTDLHSGCAVSRDQIHQYPSRRGSIGRQNLEDLCSGGPLGWGHPINSELTRSCFSRVYSCRSVPAVTFSCTSARWVRRPINLDSETSDHVDRSSWQFKFIVHRIRACFRCRLPRSKKGEGPARDEPVCRVLPPPFYRRTPSTLARHSG